MMLTVRLSEDVVERLSRPIVGEGGFQGILRLLRDRTEDGTLSVAVGEAQRIVRYVDDYGGGGFQQRLRPLADSLRTLLDSSDD